jgi:hypothetical protein
MKNRSTMSRTSETDITIVLFSRSKRKFRNPVHSKSHQASPHRIPHGLAICTNTSQYYTCVNFLIRMDEPLCGNDPGHGGGRSSHEDLESLLKNGYEMSRTSNRPAPTISISLL